MRDDLLGCHSIKSRPKLARPFYQRSANESSGSFFCPESIALQKQDDEAVFKGKNKQHKRAVIFSSTLLSKVDKLEAASMYNAPLLSYFFFTPSRAPSLKGTRGGDVRSPFAAADTKVVLSLL